MEQTPEEYGEYWRGAIRMTAGSLLVFYSYLIFSSFSDLLYANVVGVVFLWGVFGLVVLVGWFAVAVGLSIVVKTAVDGP